MSHFYGKLQGARGEATRCGNKHTGLEATAAAWCGSVETTLWHDEATGVDMAEVRLARWQGRGVSRVLYRGPINPDEDQETLNIAQIKRDLNPRDEGEAADAAERARTARTGGEPPNPFEMAGQEAIMARDHEYQVERIVCRRQAAHEHAEIWRRERAANRAADEADTRSYETQPIEIDQLNREAAAREATARKKKLLDELDGIAAKTIAARRRGNHS